MIGIIPCDYKADSINNLPLRKFLQIFSHTPCIWFCRLHSQLCIFSKFPLQKTINFNHHLQGDDPRDCRECLWNAKGGLDA
ncbi:hypothetical protein SDJN02_02498, partial [Cucurbita argyrosperma subsp. argyrosperma]